MDSPIRDRSPVQLPASKARGLFGIAPRSPAPVPMPLISDPRSGRLCDTVILTARRPCTWRPPRAGSTPWARTSRASLSGISSRTRSSFCVQICLVDEAGENLGVGVAALTRRSDMVSHLTGAGSRVRPGPRFRVIRSTGGRCSTRSPRAGRRRWSPGARHSRWRSLGPGAGHRPRAHRALWHRAAGADRARRWDAFYPGVAAPVRGRGTAAGDPWGAVSAVEVLDVARLSARELRAAHLEGINGVGRRTGETPAGA